MLNSKLQTAISCSMLNFGISEFCYCNVPVLPTERGKSTCWHPATRWVDLTQFNSVNCCPASSLTQTLHGRVPPPIWNTLTCAHAQSSSRTKACSSLQLQAGGKKDKLFCRGGSASILTRVEDLKKRSCVGSVPSSTSKGGVQLFQGC